MALERVHLLEDGVGPARKPGFGEAEGDEAENRRGVFLGLEAGVGAELVGGIPQTFFERGIVGVFFGRGDPVHKAGTDSISKSRKQKAESRKWKLEI